MAQTSSDYAGQALIRFEFEVPGGTRITFDSSIVNHERSVLTDTVYGCGRYIHSFVSTTPDYVDDTLKRVMSTGTPRMRMRLGVGNPDSIFWLPWQQQIIMDYVANPEGIGTTAGHAFNIISADLLSLLKRGQRIAAHRGLISTIVQQSLEQYELTDVVIEPTQSQGVYVQALTSEEDFLRQRMAPRALSTNGRVGYYLFCRDNTIHFHSQSYQGDVKDVIYYRSNDNVLTQLDKSQTLLDAGNAGASVIVYDPFVGRGAEYNSDPERALTLSSSVYDLESVPFANHTFGWHATSNPVDEARVVVQNAYETARRRTFAVALDLTKTIGIRHGDIVRLILAPRQEQASPWSGLYFVAEVVTKVEKGEVTSNYILERGEIEPNRSSIVQDDGARLVSELQAKGQAINLAEFESSNRTKGGEEIDNDNVFRTVRSPGD